MNNPHIQLAWTDFVLDFQDLLLDNQVTMPMYIVGGAVRDAYLRGAIHDIDIAVDGDAIAIARQVTDWLDGDIFVMDKERGVARVFVQTLEGQINLDFANFRGNTLLDDLNDRDFTVNAMVADLMGDVSQLIDPLNGQDDLNQKILRRCSPHAIQDDPIRILRAIRQSVELGLKIHPDTLTDIREHHSDIQQSSPERIRDEFFKILGSPQPSRAIRVLQHLDILKHIIDGVESIVGLPQDLPHQFDVWKHSLLVVERLNMILTAISYKRTDNTAATFDLGMLVMQFDRYRARLELHITRESGNERYHYQLLILGALLHNIGKGQSLTDYISTSRLIAQSIAENLYLTNQEQQRLISMIGAYRRVLDNQEWSDLDLHRFWYSLGENGIDAVLLAVADYLGTVGAELEQSEWLGIVERTTIILDAYFSKYETIVNPVLYLNGHDLMDLLELKGGPIIGQILTALREAQVIGDVTSVESAHQFVQQQHSLL